MSADCGLVFCVHHKPWLIQSTLITTLLQDHQDADLVFLHNVGDGVVNRPTYAEYSRVAAQSGVNEQLSPYDARVREVSRVAGRRTAEIEYENDHALDSGAWYKFIRDGRWRAYDYTLFIGEGALLTRSNSLSGMLGFAERHNVHVIGSGHEKRRLPKSLVQQYRTREHGTAVDYFHDRMVRETFEVFCRDPEFRAVYDGWRSDFLPETQNHVPDIWPRTRLERGLRATIQRRWGSPFRGDNARSLLLAPVVAGAPLAYDRIASRSSMWLRRDGNRDLDADSAYIHVNTVRRRVRDVVELEEHEGVRFHRANDLEWFATATIHLYSRTFLERLSARLDAFRMYDVLDMPFAGTALEMIWGLMPAWLGVDKWFTDAIHRVRKNFVTYAREDYPPEMASYINRYHRGSVGVSWSGDYLKIQSVKPELGHLRTTLPSLYFA